MKAMLCVLIVLVSCAAEAMGEELTIRRSERPTTLYLELEAGWQAYHRGDLGVALTHYRIAHEADKGNRDALLGLAALAMQEGRDHQAFEYWQALLRLDPRDVEAQVGLCELAQEASPAVESHLQSLLARQIEQPIVYFALGNLHARQSRWSDAVHDYARALRLASGTAQYAYNLAVALEHQGEVAAALQNYQIALAWDMSGGAGFDHALTEARIRSLAESLP